MFIDEYSKREEFNRKNERIKKSPEKLTSNDVDKLFIKKNFISASPVEYFRNVSPDQINDYLVFPDKFKDDYEKLKITMDQNINVKDFMLLDTIPKEERKKIIINPTHIKLNYSEFKKFQDEVEKKSIRRSESTGQILSAFIKENEDEILESELNKKKVGFIHFKGMNDNLKNFLSKSPSDIMKDLDKNKKSAIKYMTKSQELGII
jgi:hypothetical protein